MAKHTPRKATAVAKKRAGTKSVAAKRVATKTVTKKRAASKPVTTGKPVATPPRAVPTADGHHVIIDGRRWRATNPALAEDERQRLVNELMSARREVGRALRAGDAEAERAARERVHGAKVALGERGAKWWKE